jgi:hypothetical protein
MTLQDAAELAQGQELFPGEITQAGQDGVIGRRPVTLGQDEPVPVDPAGVFGLGAHLAKKERHQDIGGRQLAAQVAGTGPKQHLNDVEANLAGDLFEVVRVRDGGYLLMQLFHHFGRPDFP